MDTKRLLQQNFAIIYVLQGFFFVATLLFSFFKVGKQKTRWTSEETMTVGKLWSQSDINGCKKVLGLFRDMDLLMCLDEV